ncbi:uncharacterized protein [Rutidosis leptorrhynchoides]|uniref:uncharacterized protein n=1 Tax=Rutidosis leptorrhynchoides TaxID=125765 RepID=UPI003A997EEF
METNVRNFIIFGDFNEVRYAHERYGVQFNQSEAEEFNDFIISSTLVDVPLGGRTFTRANKSFTQRLLLDRILVTNGILDLWPSTTGTILSNLWYDHCPIILKSEVLDYGPIPFKLFNSWLDDDGFDEVVANSWNDISIVWSSNFQIRFKDKLKHVKEALKTWHKDLKIKCEAAKKNLLERLEVIDTHLISNRQPNNLITERVTILKDLSIIEEKEACCIAKKNRRIVHCLGDENSSFFHVSLNRKRKKVQIAGVMHNGDWISSPSHVKEVFFNFFVHKFLPIDHDNIATPSTHIHMLSRSNASRICMDASDEEIKNSVWSSNLPGLTGFLLNL